MSRSCTVWNVAKLSMLGAAAYGLFYRFPISCILGEEEPDDPLHADRLAKIQMLDKLQENPGMKFVGALRLPDSDNKNYKNIDLVILTRRKLLLVEVKSWFEKVKCEPDGSWCQKCMDGSWRRHENIVEEGQKRATLLELYLLRRGLKLPSSCVQFIVVFSNPDCSLDKSILSIPGVFSSQTWETFLRKKAQKGALGWMLSKKKRPLSDGLFQQLLDVLQTAPTWDRLRLNDGRIVLGDFLHFNGSSEDMGRLKMAKRSRISNMSITSKEEYISLLGIHLKTASWVEVRHTFRDYRRGASKTEGKDIMANESALLARVRGETEVVFQVLGSTKPQVFKIESVLSVHLSA